MAVVPQSTPQECETQIKADKSIVTCQAPLSKKHLMHR